MIEAVSQSNLKDVLPLIRQYQEFYNISNVNDEKNRIFFSQFGEKNTAGCQFIYRDEQGEAAGFATVYFSFVSSIPAKVAIMNDLYTLPEYRGKGIARKLIDHCLDYALTNGAARLQWLTAKDNQQAQNLYDSLETNKSEWLVYTYAK